MKWYTIDAPPARSIRRIISCCVARSVAPSTFCAACGMMSPFNDRSVRYSAILAKS